MARPDKEELVKEIREKVERSQGIVLADFRGLTFDEITELRKRLKAQGIEFKVVKNTLARIAMKDSPIEQADDYLVGPTAMAFGYDDAIAPARLLSEFAATSKTFSLKGGIIEGRIIDAERVKELAKLPSRDVLLSQVVGMVQAPVAAFVNVLNAPIQSLAVALGAVARQKA